METKTRTALPRPRNSAFVQGGPLVRPGNLHLMSELPADLPTKLFAKANRVQVAAGKTLFRAGATGDGCYRVEHGLLKVTMVSSSGAERILQFLGPRAIVGELSTIDGLPRSAAVVAAGSFLSLKGRVARTMLELVDHFGQEVVPGRIVIRQKIGQNDLAAMAGIARENLTRVLNDWQRHKVLSRLSGYYCLENKTQLEHQAKV